MTDETVARNAMRDALAGLDRRGIAPDVTLGAALAVIVGEMIGHFGVRLAGEQLRATIAVVGMADESAAPDSHGARP